jgi:hypothetical protein
VLVAALSGSPRAQDDLYTHDKVRDFYFTFHQPNWWNALLATETTNQDIKADLKVDGATYLDTGISIKGASSKLMPGNKKPFNVTMDTFVAGQELMGVTTMNLNNGAVDPTMTREVSSFWIFRNYFPAPRTAYVRLHFNNQFWGVYILVEQPNKDMMERWFTDEEGTRYKADRPSGVQINSSTLNWLGSGVSAYQQNYELKNSTHKNAWTDLVNLCDKLNNTPDPQFKTEIVKWLDVDRALWYLACNNMVVNSDEYMGAGHNYFMYFDPTDGRMSMIAWDNNEAYGVHGPTTSPETYPVLTGNTASNRPLVRRLLAIPEWRETYYAHYRAAMRRWSDWNTQIGPLTQVLQDSIRADIHRDPNYFYTQAQFEPTAPRFFSVFHWVPTLKDLVIARRAFLLSDPNLSKAEPQITDVRFAPGKVSSGTLVHVTANVTGTPAIKSVTLRSSAAGVYADNPMFDDGMHGDGAANDGVFGGTFTAGVPGARMRFYILGENVAGTLAFSPEAAEHVHYSIEVSFPDPTGPVVINEVLADNETGDRDEASQLEDWVEIYNRGSAPYDLSGHWLSDDALNPRKWQVPNGTVVAAQGFVRVWCDNEPTQGPLHATFKLSKEGELVALYDIDGRQNQLLDGFAYGDQKGDRSFGRFPDGSNLLHYLWQPTGNAAQFVLGQIRRYDGRRNGSALDLKLEGKGSTLVGRSFRWEISGGTPSGVALMLLSPSPSSLSLGALGHLDIDATRLISFGVTLDAQGASAIPVVVPVGMANVRIYQQAFERDLSNGLAVWFQ